MDNVAAAAAAAATAVSDEKPGAYSDGARRYRNQFVHTINGCAGDFFEPEIIILVSSLLERDVVEFVLLTSLIHIAPRPLHDAFVPRLQVRRELLGHRSARDNARSTRDLARNRSITNQRSTQRAVGDEQLVHAKQDASSRTQRARATYREADLLFASTHRAWARAACCCCCCRCWLQL